jgi:hypothetical protein
MNQSMKTEVIKRTLSPTWDQTLIFDSIEIYGNPIELLENPPKIMIEVFDHDDLVFYLNSNHFFLQLIIKFNNYKSS